MVYLLLLSIVFPLAAFASPAEEPVEKAGVFESGHDYFGERMNSLANSLDSFFANERADDELGRSRIRIQPSYTVREREKGFDKIRYRINLRLPHLEEKFKWEYYRDRDKSEDEKTSEAVARKIERANRVRTGWLFNADLGVSVAIPPSVTTRARLRKNFDHGTWIHRFVEQLIYVTNEDGLTEETGLQNDYRIDDTKLFRFINNKRWRVLKKTFVTIHGPTVLHQYTDNDAFSYNLLMTNLIDNGTYFVNSYTLSVGYRRNLYKKWLFLDFVPGIDFPKQWSFRRTPYIFAQLEILFGG